VNATNLFGLRVAGITALIFFVLFGLYLGGRTLLTRNQDGEPGGDEFTLAERQQDTDGDGVADLYETAYYNTDPNNRDTDGDGESDLNEIVGGSDPLVPGPQDEIRPPTGSAVGSTETFTQRYLASLPDDVPREEILDQARVEAFIEANRGVLLPTLPEGAVTTVAGAGAQAVSTYLDAISSVHNNSLKAVTSSDIEAAFRLQINSSQPQPMRDLVIALTNNVGVLEGIAAPAEAAALHTKLVAASRALRDNATALSNIQDDFVGGLIAAKNVEALGSIFQEIALDVQALEQKYGLE
jgi:hypothetical protein